jgi:hypothetical protein
MRSAAAVLVVILGVAGAAYAQVQQPAGTEQQNDRASSPKSSLPAPNTSPPQPPENHQTQTVNKEPPAAPVYAGSDGKSTRTDDDGTIWYRLWPPFLTGLLALIGSGSAILYQKHALEKTLNAQEGNLEKSIRAQLTVSEASINAQLATAESRLRAEAEDKKKVEEGCGPNAARSEGAAYI